MMLPAWYNEAMNRTGWIHSGLILMVVLATAGTASAMPCFFNANPRLDQNFLDAGLQQVSVDVTSEQQPVPRGSCLRWAAECFVAPSGLRGAPTNIGPASSKGFKQVTPGIRELEGHYIDDLGRVQPWRAHYDEYGRMIGRTDYNARNITDGIPDTHHHRYEYNSRFPLGREIESHTPGEFPN